MLNKNKMFLIIKTNKLNKLNNQRLQFKEINKIQMMLEIY